MTGYRNKDLADWILSLLDHRSFPGQGRQFTKKQWRQVTSSEDTLFLYEITEQCILIIAYVSCCDIRVSFKIVTDLKPFFLLIFRIRVSKLSLFLSLSLSLLLPPQIDWCSSVWLLLTNGLITVNNMLVHKSVEKSYQM